MKNLWGRRWSPHPRNSEPGNTGWRRKPGPCRVRTRAATRRRLSRDRIGERSIWSRKPEPRSEDPGRGEDQCRSPGRDLHVFPFRDITQDVLLINCKITTILLSCFSLTAFPTEISGGASGCCATFL